MTDFDLRQDKAYRRGLVLGLTVAETMILLVFALLFTLTASLYSRDQEIAYLRAVDSDPEDKLKLVEFIHQEYPEASDIDQLFKELKLSHEARKLMEKASERGANLSSLAEDAEVGRTIRELSSENDIKKNEIIKTLSYIVANNGSITETTLEKLNEIAKTNSLTLEQLINNVSKLPSDQIGGTSNTKKRETPPFISLSEAGGFYFESGSAELKESFKSDLSDKTIPSLLKIISEYDVNIIEVIGHTDEVPMRGESNLDYRLISAMKGTSQISGLRFGDNAALGIARAVSVSRILRSDPRLSGMTILPLSGAQMVVPIDHIADGSQPSQSQERRRIEIRLRKTTGATINGE